jgi:hypothetical protein
MRQSLQQTFFCADNLKGNLEIDSLDPFQWRSKLENTVAD